MRTSNIVSDLATIVGVGASLNLSSPTNMLDNAAKFSSSFAPVSSSGGDWGANFVANRPEIVQNYYPVPERSAALWGFPLEAERTIGEVSGLTVCTAMHLDGVSASESEKSDIMRKFADGVIV